MNKGLGVFLSLLLCVVFCVGVITVLNNAGDSNGWMQKQQNSHVFSARSTSASSAAYHEGAGLGRVAVPMFSRHSSTIGSRRMVGSNGATYSSQSMQYSMGGMSSVSQSPLSYMSSSHTMKSFGGGGNTGVSMSGGVVSNSASSLGSGVSVGIQSPIAYTQLQTINTQSPIVSNYQGVGNTTTTVPRGMRGRRNLAIDDDNVEDSWLNWLALMGIGVEGIGRYDEVTNTWYYDYYELQKLYQEFCNNWNSGMGKKPTWWEWVDWFMGSEGDPYIWDDGDRQYGFSYVPVGDFMPLIVFALLYVVLMVYRRRQCRMINSSEDVE